MSLPPQIVHDTFTVVIPTGARAPATAERRNLLFACGGSSPGQVPGRHYHCNGCPFVNAVAEIGERSHPATRIAIDQKERRRVAFRDILTRLGVADPDGLATQLAILVEGAMAAALVRDDLADAGARAAGGHG